MPWNDFHQLGLVTKLAWLNGSFVISEVGVWQSGGKERIFFTLTPAENSFLKVHAGLKFLVN
jgi:hypothetical protein